jgi:hypothetical protein
MVVQYHHQTQMLRCHHQKPRRTLTLDETNPLVKPQRRNDAHNSRTNLEARSRMTDFVVRGGLEGHRCGLPISSLRLAARMASPAMIVCNRGESGLPDAAMGHRRRPMGLRPT